MVSRRARIAYLKRMISRLEGEISRFDSLVQEGKMDGAQETIVRTLIQDGLRQLRAELGELQRSR